MKLKSQGQGESDSHSFGNSFTAEEILGIYGICGGNSFVTHPARCGSEQHGENTRLRRCFDLPYVTSIISRIIQAEDILPLLTTRSEREEIRWADMSVWWEVGKALCPAPTFYPYGKTLNQKTYKKCHSLVHGRPGMKGGDNGTGIYNRGGQRRGLLPSEQFAMHGYQVLAGQYMPERESPKAFREKYPIRSPASP